MRLVVVSNVRGLQEEFEAFLAEMAARYPGSAVLMVGDVGHIIPGIEDEGLGRMSASVLEQSLGSHTRSIRAHCMQAFQNKKSSELVDSFIQQVFSPSGTAQQAARSAAMLHYRTLFRRWADALPPGGLLYVNGGALDMMDELEACLSTPLRGSQGGIVSLLHGNQYTFGDRITMAGISSLLPGPCGLLPELSNVFHPDEYLRRLRLFRQPDLLCVNTPYDLNPDIREGLLKTARIVLCPAIPFIVSSNGKSSQTSASEGDSQISTIGQTVLVRVRGFSPNRNYVLMDLDPSKMSANALDIEFLCASKITASLSVVTPRMKPLEGEVRVHSPAAISILANFSLRNEKSQKKEKQKN